MSGDEEERRASGEERRLLERLAVPPGLCATCEHLRLLASKRSVFVRCGLAAVDPRFSRYPPLPVRICPGHLPVAGPSPRGEGQRRT